MARPPASVGRTVRRLALAALAMFGFGYALVPIYNVACEQLGLNGRAAGLSQVASESAGTSPTPGSAPDTSARMVTVEFVGNAGQGLDWEFRPNTARMQVRVGELVETTYHVRNRAAHTIVGQAVPSVAPGSAARHFHKIECFCFTRQPLAAGEAKDLPVRFRVDPQLAEGVHTLTLSYTFFDAGAQAQAPARPNS